MGICRESLREFGDAYPSRAATKVDKVAAIWIDEHRSDSLGDSFETGAVQVLRNTPLRLVRQYAPRAGDIVDQPRVADNRHDAKEAAVVAAPRPPRSFPPNRSPAH